MHSDEEAGMSGRPVNTMFGNAKNSAVVSQLFRRIQQRPDADEQQPFDVVDKSERCVVSAVTSNAVSSRNLPHCSDDSTASNSSARGTASLCAASVGTHRSAGSGSVGTQFFEAASTPQSHQKPTKGGNEEARLSSTSRNFFTEGSASQDDNMTRTTATSMLSGSTEKSAFDVVSLGIQSSSGINKGYKMQLGSNRVASASQALVPFNPPQLKECHADKCSKMFAESFNLSDNDFKAFKSSKEPFAGIKANETKVETAGKSTSTKSMFPQGLIDATGQAHNPDGQNIKSNEARSHSAEQCESRITIESETIIHPSSPSSISNVTCTNSQYLMDNPESQSEISADYSETRNLIGPEEGEDLASLSHDGTGRADANLDQQMENGDSQQTVMRGVSWSFSDQFQDASSTLNTTSNCSFRTESPEKVTTFLRENNIAKGGTNRRSVKTRELKETRCMKPSYIVIGILILMSLGFALASLIVGFKHSSRSRDVGRGIVDPPNPADGTDIQDVPTDHFHDSSTVAESPISTSSPLPSFSEDDNWDKSGHFSFKNDEPTEVPSTNTAITTTENPATSTTTSTAFTSKVKVETTSIATTSLTEAPDAVSYSRFEAIRNLVASVSPEGTVTSETSTPQFRALAWLAYNDVLQVPLQEKERLLQRYVMAVLFYSSGVDTFETKGTSECKWSRYITRPKHNNSTGPVEVRGKEPVIGDIGCDSDGNIVKIRLGFGCTEPLRELAQLRTVRKLNAKFCRKHATLIPSFVGEMYNLEQMDISGSTFSGPFPSSFENLKNLAHLDLSRCRFEGNFPSVENKFGNLRSLNLSNAKIEGNLPDSLGQLEHLTRLDLSSLRFSGTLPLKMDSLPQLRYLSLRALSFVRRPFPDCFGKLIQLEELNMDDVSFGGLFPPTIGSLEKLTSLEMSRITFDGPLPSSMMSLSRLETLNLSNSAIPGRLPPFLWNQGNLTNLDLSGNKFKGSISKGVVNLTGLNRMDFSGNFLTGQLPSEIGALTRLRFMDLSYNAVSGFLPPEIGNLAPLQTLNLCSNSMKGTLPPTIGNLKLLKTLRLCRNGFSGSLPKELKKLENLEFLSISESDFSGTLHHLNALLKLKHLYVSDTLISGPLPPELGLAVNLTTLNLGSNMLSGKIPHQLGNLRKLERLVLSDNMLNGFVPEELGEIKGLRVLDLTRNSLSGTITPSLGKLQMLRWLKVSFNQIEGGIPTEFGLMGSLMTLLLDNNKLNGTIPSEMGRLSKLRNLRLDTNALTGDVPSAFHKKLASNLRMFTLYDNKLKGLGYSQLCSSNVATCENTTKSKGENDSDEERSDESEDTKDGVEEKNSKDASDKQSIFYHG